MSKNWPQFPARLYFRYVFYFTTFFFFSAYFRVKIPFDVFIVLLSYKDTDRRSSRSKIVRSFIKKKKLSSQKWYRSITNIPSSLDAIYAIFIIKSRLQKSRVKMNCLKTIIFSFLLNQGGKIKVWTVTEFIETGKQNHFE